MIKRVIACSLVGSLLFGCSSTPHYADNNFEKNVTINLTMDESSGLFSSVDVAAGINDYDDACQHHYRGFVELVPGENKIGLAPGVLTYLMVEITHSRFRKTSRFSRGTMIQPKRGRQYVVDINYADSMYDFRVYEVRGSKRKELKLVSDPACRTNQHG